MKAKTFGILLVATGVLVALAYLRLGSDAPTGNGRMGDALFADLPVNKVAKVTIADDDGRVTLVKGESFWQVAERNDYPADFDALRDMVVKLSRLKIGRSFTGSDDSLKRLSLMPPSSGDTDSGGTQIALADASGTVVADVILGQTRTAEGGGTGGQYLKKADADTVFLVDNTFRFLKTAPAEWLQKEILDIKSDQVSSVTCYAGDSPTPAYTLVRPETGKPARMTPVPDGREVDANKIDQVLDALGPLNLDDVSVAQESTAAGEFRLVYGLVDGRQITILPHTDGGERYAVRVMAADGPVGETAAQRTSASGDNETAATPGSGDAAAAATDETPPVKTAREINQQVGPWVFWIKKWQFDSFVTQPTDLLKAVKEPEKS